MYIVTGGAGFIGSCIIRALNDVGIDDIIIVDNIHDTNKWLNIRNKRYISYVHKTEFIGKLQDYGEIEVIIHMGAQSSTTEKDFDYLWKNNVEYTKMLWEYCAQHNVRFIYASSAATYGDGEVIRKLKTHRGDVFDDRTDIDGLKPLNAYGYSKQLFDLWVKHQAKQFPRQYVGLKFFNVYGPNEYCKGSMASMAFHGFQQIKSDGEIRLFQSLRAGIPDGGQKRDFVYVKDLCSVILWLLKHEEVNGLFNVGTGRAQSFKELAEAVFFSLGKEVNIRYIDMPTYLADKYQYYTKAEIKKLRDAGYTEPFMDVQEGVADYVQNYLDKGFDIY